MEKNTLNSVIGASLALAITLGVGGSAILLNSRKNNTNKDSVIVDEGNDYKIRDKGLGIKYLSSSLNSFGQEDKTFSYSIKPDNATNKKINLDLKYQDGTECNDVMTANVDESLMTVTLSCLADFDKKIIVTITSEDNPSANAEITLDYTKKIIDVSKNYETLEIGEFNYQHGDINIDHFEDKYFYVPNYSKYTKDVNYSFEVKDFDVNFDEFLGGMDGPYDKELNESLSLLLENAIKSHGNVSDEELWNASSLNSWHAWLKASTGEGVNYIGFNVSYKVYNNNKEYLNDSVYIYLGTTGRNFDGKLIGVDSVIADTDNIDF